MGDPELGAAVLENGGKEYAIRGGGSGSGGAAGGNTGGDGDVRSWQDDDEDGEGNAALKAPQGWELALQCHGRLEEHRLMHPVRTSAAR